MIRPRLTESVKAWFLLLVIWLAGYATGGILGYQTGYNKASKEWLDMVMGMMVQPSSRKAPSSDLRAMSQRTHGGGARGTIQGLADRVQPDIGDTRQSVSAGP